MGGQREMRAAVWLVTVLALMDDEYEKTGVSIRRNELGSTEWGAVDSGKD